MYIGIRFYIYLAKLYLQINKKEILDSIPSVECETNRDISKRKNKKEEEDNKDCLICLTTIVLGKQLHCGHIFHQICIEEFMDENSTLSCPVCGIEIVLSKINYARIQKKNPNHYQILAHMIQLSDDKNNKCINKFPDYALEGISKLIINNR